MARPPKLRKDIAELIGEFERAGWRVVYPKSGYVKVLCPCGDHKRWIHKTPSDPNYCKNALQWLYRQPCYRERQGR